MDRPAILSRYNEQFSDRPLDMASAGGLFTLLDFLRADEAITDPRRQAYCLATARHETGSDFRCRAEIGTVPYFAKYEPGTPIGTRLGNLIAGDGYKFRGRGYVQITGRSNYSRFGALLQLDLAGDPDAALEPHVAYRILSLGMSQGLFTGKKLADYIAGPKCSYLDARRIINGQDKAELIAGYARKFEALLLREPA